MDGDVDRQNRMMGEAKKRVKELITHTLTSCNFDNTYPGCDPQTWLTDDTYTALQCAMRATHAVWERLDQRHIAGAILEEDDFVALDVCVRDFTQTLEAFTEKSQRHDEFLDSLVDSYNTMTDEARDAAAAFRKNPHEFPCDVHDSYKNMAAKQKVAGDYLSAAVDFRISSVVPLPPGELEKMFRMVVEAQEAVSQFRTLNSV